MRRAFLCGDDKYIGKSYDHSCGWGEEQILKLTEVFVVDVAACSVTSDHQHVTLTIALEIVNIWPDWKSIRAKVAKTSGKSDYISTQQRVNAALKEVQPARQ
ncbi:hypothetical protein Spea_0492 [Shewanella pealeana ATCC 700345]|uniref:Uncharacterized protein n=1 Tax=Shewanella pealeana (strain ATCC 700345 / ANG-SQ1) TaxID=398579 RepID=A8GZT3_SHEPA|nr:hypothetical protein Spea_0492 [Shewanella pealeana ATCC 700345]